MLNLWTDASVLAAASPVRKGSTFPDHWARCGIAGRGVLLDLDRALNEGGRSYTPDGATAFSVADLEHARSCSGIEFSPGCIILGPRRMPWPSSNEEGPVPPVLPAAIAEARAAVVRYGVRLVADHRPG